MNSFLSICLALNLFTSSLISPTLSFIVSPNPFTNSSIHYEFSTSGEAANYYYQQCISNSINYSDSDLLGMLCVLAKLYYEESSNIDSSLLSNIQSFFSTIRTSYSFYNRHILALYNGLGYIVRSDSNYMNWLYNLLVNQEQWAQDPELHYFYYLYDNIEFTRTGLDINPILADKLCEAASSEQSVPYTLLPINFVDDFNFSTSLFPDLDLYSSFLSDLKSFGSTHTYFGILLLSSSTTGYNLILSDGSWINNGYLLYAIPEDAVAVKSSFTGSNYDLDFYNTSWNKATFSSSDVLCRYSSSGTVSSGTVDSIFIRAYSNQRRALTDSYLYTLCSRVTTVTSNDYPYSYVDFYFPNYIYSSIFSTKNHDFLIFDSLQAFENYTLSNSLYFKANSSSNFISYDTYNNYEGLYIANQTTYNSINNYITDNSVSYIDNSTQTIINNYYNYDIDYNYSETINNITNINEAEDSYLFNFNQAFDNSGYSDYSFTSWTDSDGSSSSFTTSFSPVIALLDSFYLYLPSKLKMVIAGVLAVGLFGLILAVGVHLGRK